MATAALASLAGLFLGCESLGHRPSVNSKQGASKTYVATSNIAYLWSCDPEIARLDLESHTVSDSWNLATIARPYVLYGRQVDGCPVHSPLIDPVTGRLFFATGKTASEDAEGHRPDLIVGVQLSPPKVTDVIGGSWALEDPVQLLHDGNRRLFASDYLSDHEPGVGAGQIIEVDVGTPGNARIARKVRGASFGDKAIFRDDTIWENDHAIQFNGETPVGSRVDPAALLSRPEGDALRPYAFVPEGAHEPSVTVNLQQGLANRVLFTIPTAPPTLTLAIGTIFPSSIHIIKTNLDPSYVHLVNEGHEILIESVKMVPLPENPGRSKAAFTGRLILLDTATGATKRDWHLEFPDAEGARYMCGKGDLFLFGLRDWILVVRADSPTVKGIPLGRKINFQYDRCFFASR